MRMEYVVVSYPTARDVRIDGQLAGKDQRSCSGWNVGTIRSTWETRRTISRIRREDCPRYDFHQAYAHP